MEFRVKSGGVRVISHRDAVRPRFGARSGLIDVRAFALNTTLWALALLAGLWTPTLVQAQVVTYQVDPASGRVLKATYPNGAVVIYTYDGNGNEISAAIDTTAPSAPGSISVSFNGSSIGVSWGASTDNNVVAGYSYSINGGTYSTSGSQTAADLSALNLAAGQTYTLSVTAHDPNGNVSQTTSTTFTVPPGAPGTPTVTGVNGAAGTATLSWSAAQSASAVTYSYQLNSGAWTSVGAALSVSLSSLNYSTNYTLSVRAAIGSVVGPASATRSFSLGASPPGAPTISNITGTSATATWTAASDSLSISGYSYSLNNGSSWVSVGSALTANLTGLAYGTTYTVLVRAQDANGAGPMSQQNFSTQPSAPGAPTASNIAGTTTTVSWGAATDHNGVTAYQYQLNSGSWISAGTATSINLTGLAYGTAYTINVRAVDANGTGPALAGNFTTAPNVPGTPSFSNITASTATAAWGAAATGNSAISGYSYQLNGGTWSAYSTATAVNLSGLAAGTTYTLAVRAQDAGGSVGATSSGSFTTAPGTPGTPTFSNLTPNSATVSWTAATSAVGITGYRYSLNGGSTWTSTGTALVTNLTGLSLGASYTVQVEALNSSGIWSAASSKAFTTPSYYTDVFALVASTTDFANGFDYLSGIGGSITPDSTSNGKTVIVAMTSCTTVCGTTLEMMVFNTDPGAGWLQSVSIGNVSLTGVSATYSFSGGVAVWRWSSALITTVNSTMTLAHQ